MFALNCRLKPLWKTKPLTASLQSEAEPHWTGSAPRALQAGHKPMSAPFGCLRWKKPSCVCLFPFVFSPNAAITESKDRLGWQHPGIWGYTQTMIKRPPSGRHPSHFRWSCPVWPPGWSSLAFSSFSLERKFAYCVYLTMKMTVDIPSNWKRMGFFKANFLKALGIKGVPYY